MNLTKPLCAINTFIQQMNEVSTLKKGNLFFDKVSINKIKIDSFFIC